MTRRVLVAIAPVFVFLVLRAWLEPIVGPLTMRVLTWLALGLGFALYFKFAEDWGLVPGPYERSVRELLKGDENSEASDRTVRKE